MSDYPLDKFKSWLLTCDLKLSTANQYASLVRKVLRACGGAPATVEAITEVEAGVPAAERVMFRTAWRSYVAFAADRRQALPTLPDQRSRTRPLPSIAPLLFALTRIVPLHFIPELRWGNVRATGGDEAEVCYPDGSYVWRVPLDLVQRIRSETKPENTSTPLVRSESRPSEPMPLPRLRNLVQRAEVEGTEGRTT
jgi:hypothetical protein